ncbi:MAG: InlB B-repeat-containing protein [Kiritimatiellaeota bacterium]|nr:InlB B-repeat-containing protein [Kiritimatiellota bacterium]
MKTRMEKCWGVALAALLAGGVSSCGPTKEAGTAKKDLREIHESVVQQGGWENVLHSVDDWANVAKAMKAKGENILDKRGTKRFDVWKTAAGSGIAQGQTLLGLCCLSGSGVDKNHNMGKAWIEKAAKNRCSVAAVINVDIELCGYPPDVPDDAQDGGGDPPSQDPPPKEVTECTVTFDAQGATLPFVSKTVTNGMAYGTLPLPLPYRGFRFNGYYSAPNGDGRKIESTTRVEETADHTLYIHWIP